MKFRDNIYMLLFKTSHLSQDGEAGEFSDSQEILVLWRSAVR